MPQCFASVLEVNNLTCVQAASRAGKYLIENFVIHGLVAAVALPMTVLSVSSLIDSTWAVVICRHIAISVPGI